jgi:hypothetical protein
MLDGFDSSSHYESYLNKELQIIPADELKATKTVDASTVKFYRGLRHRSIKDILKYAPTYGSKYQSLVLCNSVSVKK